MTTNNAINVATGATGTVLSGQGVGVTPLFTATPTVTGITISGTPSAGTDGTNVTYVQSALATVNPSTSVYAATTTNIPGTYTPVGSGIGDTFLTTATGAFTLDGTTPPLASRILFKDQSTTFQNGVYTLTTNGTGITGTLFTRALDYDRPSDINSTGVIAVVNGTANNLTGWLLNVTVTTVGSSPITYVQYNYAPSAVTQFNSLVGGASNAIVSVAPSATSGVPLISQGSSANPAFGTAVVAGGGTGDTSFTAYTPICGGTTTTGALQSVASIGTAGQVLTSNGAGALPTFQASSASGSMVLLQSQSASGSASIAFTSTYVTNTYDVFFLLIQGLRPSSGSTLNMTLSTNNGATYISTGYKSGNWYFTYNSATVNNQNTTSAIQLLTGASTTIPTSGYIYLYNFANGIAPNTTGTFAVADTYWQQSFGSNTTTTINNFKLAFDSGNISTGLFSLYGLVQ